MQTPYGVYTYLLNLHVGTYLIYFLSLTYLLTVRSLRTARSPGAGACRVAVSMVQRAAPRRRSTLSRRRAHRRHSTCSNARRCNRCLRRARYTVSMGSIACV